MEEGITSDWIAEIHASKARGGRKPSKIGGNSEEPVK
jgi:hypothetical protein